MVAVKDAVARVRQAHSVDARREGAGRHQVALRAIIPEDGGAAVGVLRAVADALARVQPSQCLHDARVHAGSRLHMEAGEWGAAVGDLISIVAVLLIRRRRRALVAVVDVAEAVAGQVPLVEADAGRVLGTALPADLGTERAETPRSLVRRCDRAEVVLDVEALLVWRGGVDVAVDPDQCVGAGQWHLESEDEGVGLQLARRRAGGEQSSDASTAQPGTLIEAATDVSGEGGTQRHSARLRHVLPDREAGPRDRAGGGLEGGELPRLRVDDSGQVEAREVVAGVGSHVADLERQTGGAVDACLPTADEVGTGTDCMGGCAQSGVQELDVEASFCIAGRDFVDRLDC